MHIVKSFLISQLCQSGYLTYHCMCHNYLMDLQHSHEIFLNKQEKRRKKVNIYNALSFIRCRFQIVDIVLQIQSYELHLSVIDSQLYLIHLKICITELKIDNRYEAIHNKNISTKDLKTGTIQCSHRSFKIGKTHRACKELTKRIHGELRYFNCFMGIICYCQCL